MTENKNQTSSQPTEDPKPTVSAVTDQATTESKPAKRILIGSQRDAADKTLTPTEPKAVRFAKLAPQNVGNAIRGGSGTTPVVDEAIPAPTSATPVVDEAIPAPTSATPVVDETIPAPTSATPVVDEAIPAPTSATPVVDETIPAPTSTTPPGDDVAAIQPQPADADLAAAAVEPSSVESIDAELEMALDDLQMDALIAGNEPAAELELDSRVKGIVSRIHNENVFFSLKGRYEGIASMRQFKEPPSEGAMLDVVVLSHNEDEGLYEVAIPGTSISIGDWSDLSEGAVVETRVTGSNTGGLECTINNIRGFIPASQIDIVRVENLNDFINQKLQCVVTEVNPKRKKLVLSRRAILERQREEKKAELMSTIAPGQTLDGIVTKLMDFGAFVDIGGVEGLVHVSKMSWDRVSHPKDILEVGEKISVKIEKINPENDKISLSYRDTQENPWSKIDQRYPPGEVVTGTVSRLAQFGAFVKLEPGVEGLVHISELAHHRVMAVKNVVNQGDQVQVKVLSVDPSAQKIGLSLKATQAKPQKKDDKNKQAEPPEELRESAVKQRNEPLKGGRDNPSGGEQFGLNW